MEEDLPLSPHFTFPSSPRNTTHTVQDASTQADLRWIPPFPIPDALHIIERTMSIHTQATPHDLTEIVAQELYIPPADTASMDFLFSVIHSHCSLTRSLTAHLIQLSQLGFQFDPSGHTSVVLIAHDLATRASRPMYPEHSALEL